MCFEYYTHCITHYLTETPSTSLTAGDCSYTRGLCGGGRAHRPPPRQPTKKKTGADFELWRRKVQTSSDRCGPAVSAVGINHLISAFNAGRRYITCQPHCHSDIIAQVSVLFVSFGRRNDRWISLLLADVNVSMPIASLETLNLA